MNQLDHTQLVAALGASDPIERLEAAFGLAQLGSWSGRTTLLEGLSSPEGHVRSHATYLLGRIGASSAAGAIAQRLSDPQTTVRNEAIFALVKIGLPVVVPALIQAMRDEDPARREDARVALVLLLGDEVAALLDDWGEQEGEADKVAAWWAEHGHKYDAETVYQSGRPLSIGDTIAELRRAPPEVVEALLEPLRDWTGQNFEGQPSELAELWSAWWRAHELEFPPGRRYFHGRPVETGLTD